MGGGGGMVAHHARIYRETAVAPYYRRGPSSFGSFFLACLCPLLDAHGLQRRGTRVVCTRVLLTLRNMYHALLMNNSLAACGRSWSDNAAAEVGLTGEDISFPLSSSLSHAHPSSVTHEMGGWLALKSPNVGIGCMQGQKRCMSKAKRLKPFATRK